MQQLSNLSIAEKGQLLELLIQKREVERSREAFKDYAGFVKHFSQEPPPARHHRYLIEKLDQVAKGEIKRLMVFMPPGSAKSTYTSVLFPPFWLEQNPRGMIIGASHDTKLAERFGRKVRNIVDSEEYEETSGVTLSPDSRAAGQWETTQESEYYAAGVGSSVTGRRADIGFIDDPVKGRKESESEAIQNDTFEWYKSDFRTRLKPDAAIVIIQTRWVENDLSGRILPEDYDGKSGPVISRDGEMWEVVNLPMEAREDDALGRKVGELLWPEWFNHEWVSQEKRTQGPRNWGALFQQDPAPDEGDYFKRANFRWYDRKPEHLKLYLSGDFAVTEEDEVGKTSADPDFTEMGIFGIDPMDNIYIIDWFRGRIDILDIVNTFLDLNDLHDPLYGLGESGVIRRAIEPILKRRMRERRSYIPLEWLHTSSDKPAMARSFQALVQQNRVYLPSNKDWAEALLSQLTKFPGGRWDDGVDVCSLFGRFINQTWKAQKPARDKKPIKVSGRPKLTIASFHDDEY